MHNKILLKVGSLNKEILQMYSERGQKFSHTNLELHFHSFTHLGAGKVEMDQRDEISALSRFLVLFGEAESSQQKN